MSSSRLEATLARASTLLARAANSDWPLIVAATGESVATVPPGAISELPTVREATAEEVRVYRKSLTATAAFAESAAMSAVRALPSPPATFDDALLYLATALVVPGLPALGAPQALYGKNVKHNNSESSSSSSASVALPVSVPSPAEVEVALSNAAAADEDVDDDDDNDDDDDANDNDEEEDDEHDPDLHDDSEEARARFGRKRALRPLFRLTKRARRTWAARALDMLQSHRSLAQSAAALARELSVLQQFALDGGALLADAAAEPSISARALAYFTVVRELGHAGLREMQLATQAARPDLHAAVQAAAARLDEAAAAVAARAAALAAREAEMGAMEAVLGDAARLRRDWDRARADAGKSEEAAEELRAACAALRAAVAREKARLDRLGEAARGAEAEARGKEAAEARELCARLRAKRDETRARVAVARAKLSQSSNTAAVDTSLMCEGDVSVIIPITTDRNNDETENKSGGAGAAGSKRLSDGESFAVNGTGASTGGSDSVVRSLGLDDVDAFLDSDAEDNANTNANVGKAGAANTSVAEADASLLLNVSVNESVDPATAAAEAEALGAEARRAWAGLARAQGQAAAAGVREAALRTLLRAVAATAGSAATASATLSASSSESQESATAAAASVAVMSVLARGPTLRSAVLREVAAARSVALAAGRATVGAAEWFDAAEKAVAALVESGVISTSGDAHDYLLSI